MWFYQICIQILYDIATVWQAPSSWVHKPDDNKIAEKGELELLKYTAWHFDASFCWVHDCYHQIPFKDSTVKYTYAEI